MLENECKLRRITRSHELAIPLLAIYPVAFTLGGTDGFELDGLQRSLAQIHFQDPTRVVEGPDINP